VFAAAEVAEAFRWMSQARHIGKVVVSLDRDSIPVYPPASGRPRFSRSATYLVVGGLGGAGLRTAQWLAEHGAGQLLLVGRSGQPPADTDPRRAEACLEAVRAAGAKVLIRRCDVSHADAVAELLAEIRSRMPPLRGVVHAAMVLEDRLLSEQTAASFLSVYLPKLVGAWNLHWQTRELPLDFFVLYSSLTAAIGTPGQANYAAANAGLQALARYRRARGLEALCIDWGMLDDAGYMARHPRLADILRTDAGIQPIPLQQALTALGGLLQREVAQIGFFGIDWRKAGRMFAPALRQSLLSEVLSAAAAERGGAADHRGLQHQVLAAGDGDALALLLHHLRVQVAQVLGAETDTLDAETPLRDLGLDSLMAFQLKMQLDTAFGVNLQPGEFVQVPSLRGLAEVVLRLMRAAAQAAE
jgi:NAD(P)-dependent dehydrogenase (short-subunit alcohol dehydrogenase family)/acyl carrier protein